MNRVFADTDYWIALINRRDERHQEATAQNEWLKSTQVVTTDEVLVELLAYFSGRLLRRAAAEFVELLLESREVEVVSQTRESFLGGLALYRERHDKTYSLTDCISMRLMKERGLHEVLSGDHHFEQEGLVPLLRRA